MRIFAIDPGPTESGWVVLEDNTLIACGVDENDRLLGHGFESPTLVAIEKIVGMGMPVGQETFDTCVWIGRYFEDYHRQTTVRLVSRREVKLYLCGITQAKDANIRRALMDKFARTGGGKTPEVGTKEKPGPLFGIKTHAWSALAVAITARDT